MEKKVILNKAIGDHEKGKAISLPVDVANELVRTKEARLEGDADPDEDAKPEDDKGKKAKKD